MIDTRQLLADFVNDGSDAAFRELVDRYINFVYSTALRLMDGDTQLAEDVTQVVFVDLARNAAKLGREPMLGGWLHRDTCFVASKIKRGEQRRRAREREALLMNTLQDHSDANLQKLAPILDEAINELGTEDRHAILLRFYEQQDFRSVASALGSSEDAARMRVTRALEKLQGLLKRQGVALSATALGSALATGTVVASPAALAGSVTAVATSVAALTTVGTAASTAGLLTMTKIKAAFVAPLIVAGLTATLLVQTHGNLRDSEERSRLDRIKLVTLEAENQRLSKLLADGSNITPVDQSELLKLRGEVGVLKRQLAEAQTARFEALDPQEELTPAEQKYMDNILRQQYLTRMKIGFAKNWMLAFHMYSIENNGKFPENFSAAANYLRKSEDDTIFLATNDFTLVYKRSLPDRPPGETVVFTSAPELVIPSDPAGGWYKIYAFADGHIERMEQADGNFDEIEKNFGIEQ